MGYGLVYENMLESVMFAKEHFLKPSGIVLPETFKLYLAGFEHLPRHLHSHNDSFWTESVKNSYGFDMSAMRSLEQRMVHLDFIKENNIATDSDCILEFDLREFTKLLVRSYFG